MTAQARLLAVVEALAAGGYRGVRNAEIVARLSIGAAQVCRDLALLRQAGWAERRPDGRTRLSAKFAAYSARIAMSLRDARLEIQREEAVYTEAVAGPGAAHV